jgi:hypothetical protein
VVLGAAGLLGAALTAKYAEGLWSLIFAADAMALVAAVFLIRGSLQTARLVRMTLALIAGATAMGVLGLAVIQPIQLSVTEIRLDPMAVLWPAVILAVAVGGGLWLIRELDREPIRTATANAGSRHWNSATPAKAGAAAMFLAVMLQWLALHGKSADAAASLAQEQLGLQYRYALTSISNSSKDGHTSVSGVVTAWNETEVKKVILHWVER